MDGHAPEFSVLFPTQDGFIQVTYECQISGLRVRVLIREKGKYCDGTRFKEFHYYSKRRNLKREVCRTSGRKGHAQSG